MLTNTTVAIKSKFISSLLLFAVIFLVARPLRKELFFCGFPYKKRYQQIYFWSKIFSLTLYAMLKLSKTTSPQTDCITLYCG